MADILRIQAKYDSAMIVIEEVQGRGNLLDKRIFNTGIGIPTEKFELIFEKFRQGDKGYSRQFEGSGLGLAIAKAYLEKLNGKIWVESNLGNGAIFYFTQPYKLPLNKPGS